MNLLFNLSNFVPMLFIINYLKTLGTNVTHVSMDETDSKFLHELYLESYLLLYTLELTKIQICLGG